MPLVVGAPGEEEYASGFQAAGEAWRKAAEGAQTRFTLIGAGPWDSAATAVEAPAAGAPPPPPSPTLTDKDRLKGWIDGLTPDNPQPVWIIYIGHGTFDTKEARLNLRGPDVAVTEVQAWLASLQRPLVFVDGGSASGPFLPALSAPGRVVITATEGGTEVNYARFGERFAEVIADPAADLDQDGQTTVLEAYLSAAQRVQVFYAEAQRMPTEHALLDDNGDRRGTPPDWFRGTRAVKRAQDGASADGVQAHRIALVPSAAERALTAEQKSQRDRLEEDLEKLRERKDSMPARDYLRELEILLRKISAIYLAVPATAPASNSATPDS